MRIEHALEPTDGDQICFSLNFDCISLNKDDKYFKCFESKIKQSEWFKNVTIHNAKVLKICTKIIDLSQESEIKSAKRIISQLLSECYGKKAENL